MTQTPTLLPNQRKKQTKHSLPFNQPHILSILCALAGSKYPPFCIHFWDTMLTARLSLRPSNNNNHSRRCKLTRRHVLWLGMAVLVLLGTVEFALVKSHYNHNNNTTNNAAVPAASQQHGAVDTTKTTTITAKQQQQQQQQQQQPVQRLGQPLPPDATITKTETSNNKDPPPPQQQSAFPVSDSSLKRLAIVIPFRESVDPRSQGIGRETNLRQWLDHMSEFLKPELLPVTTIYVIEQSQEGIFNKGFLFNAGFDYISKDTHNNGGGGIDYFIFHDVDQIPRKGPKGCENCYDYRSSPTKLIRETTRREGNKDVIRKLSPTNVGGALMITPAIFRKINGYSNILAGWGIEDDNMAYRIKRFNGGFRVLTPGKFRGLPHARVPGLDTTDQFHQNAGQTGGGQVERPA